MRAVIVSLCFALLTAGCGSLSGGNGGDVTELHLFGLPVTLNLDLKPGADGFAVRVFASKPGRTKGAPIRSGNVEVLMFDGVVSTDHILSTPPAQSWKFTPHELSRLEEQTTLGYAYRFALRWTNAPTRGHITVLARYISNKGQPIYSSPSTITAAAQPK